MIPASCKCGRCGWYQAEGPPTCARCPQCGTGPKEGPGQYRVPTTHDIQPMVTPFLTGDRLVLRCALCGLSARQIIADRDREE